MHFIIIPFCFADAGVLKFLIGRAVYNMYISLRKYEWQPENQTESTRFNGLFLGTWMQTNMVESLGMFWEMLPYSLPLPLTFLHLPWLARLALSVTWCCEIHLKNPVKIQFLLIGSSQLLRRRIILVMWATALDTGSSSSTCQPSLINALPWEAILNLSVLELDSTIKLTKH